MADNPTTTNAREFAMATARAAMVESFNRINVSVPADITAAMALGSILGALDWLAANLDMIRQRLPQDAIDVVLGHALEKVAVVIQSGLTAPGDEGAGIMSDDNDSPGSADRAGRLCRFDRIQLRDWFAGTAMGSLLREAADDTARKYSIGVLADAAYAIADVMIEARSKKLTEPGS